MPYRVVLVTAPAVEAEALARGLVEARLAACVNVVPGVVSHYRWKGKLHRDREVLLVAKTRRSKLQALTKWVASHHPYDVPEVLALRAAGGSRRYLRFIDDGL